MAVDHAVFVHNRVPNIETGLSPYDLFTKSRWPHSKYHDLHVWGTPVYVLDKAIADGNKLPKWQPKASRHINMGFSPRHASTVPLVLNPSTGAMMAEYHVMFDDWFQTISGSDSDIPNLNSKERSDLFKSSVLQFSDDHHAGLNEVVEACRQTRSFKEFDQHDINDSRYVDNKHESRLQERNRLGPPKIERMIQDKKTKAPFQRETHRIIDNINKPTNSMPSPDRPPIPTSPVKNTPPRPPPNMQNVKPKLKSNLTKPGLVRELRDYNSQGTKETMVTGKRERKQRELFTVNTFEQLFDDQYDKETMVPDEIDFHMTHINIPVWDESSQTYVTSDRESWNSNEKLTKDHPYYVAHTMTTKLEQDMMDIWNFNGPKGTGFYNVPGSELGYKLETEPRLELHHINVPSEVLFGKASVHDPDTLTWDEAMSESDENVKQWLEAAKRKIQALESKHAWTEEQIEY